MSASEIKVGALVPVSGTVQTTFLPVLPAIKARFEAENAKGGVNGRKLTVVHKDSGNEVTRNAQGARELVENDKVFGIIEADPADEGSETYLAQNKVPVTGMALGTLWGKNKNYFAYSGGAAANSDFQPTTGGVAKFLVDQGVTKLASFGFAGNPESSSAAANSAKAFEHNGGKASYVANVPFGQQQFTADVQKLKEQNADGLSGSITADSFIPLYLAARQAGINFKAVISPTGYDQQVIQRVGKALAGVHFTTGFAPFEQELPAHKAFDEAMAKYAPDQKPARNAFAMIGWISADVFIRGLKEAGDCPTPEKFVENLRKVDDYDAGGLQAKTDFDAAFGKTPLCTYIVKIAADGSKFEPMNNGQPYCAKEG